VADSTYKVNILISSKDETSKATKSAAGALAGLDTVDTAQVATGAVASGGGLGMVMPPSVVLIIYGVLTEESIGAFYFVPLNIRYLLLQEFP